MSGSTLFENLGFIASITLPLFNFPLILKVWKRKSSEDISLTWALGVFLCLLAMEPAALISPDPLFKTFATLNLVLFSVVVFFIFFYRKRK